MSSEKNKKSNSRGKRGRVLKIICWTAGGILALVIVAIATVPLWIGPVVTSAANAIVPTFTGTDFTMSEFALNPFTGTLRINGVKLGNPKDFVPKEAFSVNTVAVDVAVFEILGGKIHVKNVEIDSVFASYVRHDGSNNVDVILGNVESKLGSGGASETSGEQTRKGGENGGLKFLIDRAVLRGTVVRVDPIPMDIPVPTIVVRDLGTESGGIDLKDLPDYFRGLFDKGFKSIGTGSADFMNDGAAFLRQKGAEGVKDLGKSLEKGMKNLSAEKAAEGLKSLGGLFKKD